MKIVFCVSTLSAGGAERVASILCNQWAAMGHHVDVLTYLRDGDDTHYKLDNGVTHHPLDLLKTQNSLFGLVKNSLKRVSVLRGKIKELKPDVVVAFGVELNIMVIGATQGLGIPTIVSERIHPEFHEIGGLRKKMRLLSYPYADAVVVQTTAIKQWFEERISAKMDVIVNPIILADFSDLGANPTDHKEMISVGRLVEQKGFDLLLQAFAKVSPRYPQWTLTIYGEGPLRAQLEEMIVQQGLEGRVALAGTTQNIAQKLASADIYVHPSRFEGYPNALVEALASGLCCVATDCAGASAELLQNGKAGLIVEPENSDDLADKLAQVMGDGDLRHKLALNARQAAQQCDHKLVAQQWIDYFQRFLS